MLLFRSFINSPNRLAFTFEPRCLSPTSVSHSNLVSVLCAPSSALRTCVFLEKKAIEVPLWKVCILHVFVSGWVCRKQRVPGCGENWSCDFLVYSANKWFVRRSQLPSRSNGSQIPVILANPSSFNESYVTRDSGRSARIIGYMCSKLRCLITLGVLNQFRGTAGFVGLHARISIL